MRKCVIKLQPVLERDGKTQLSLDRMNVLWQSKKATFCESFFPNSTEHPNMNFFLWNPALIVVGFFA